jgi:hypothetical protein
MSRNSRQLVVGGASKFPGKPLFLDSSKSPCDLELFRSTVLEKSKCVLLKETILYSFVSKKYGIRDSNSDMMCSICRDGVNRIGKWAVINGCFHYFCENCLMKAFARRNACPCCRKPNCTLKTFNFKELKKLFEHLMTIMLLRSDSDFKLDINCVGIEELFTYLHKSIDLVLHVFQSLSDRIETKRKILILALLSNNKTLDSWIEHINDPNDMFLFLCASFNLKNLLRNGINARIKFSWKTLLKVGFRWSNDFKRFITHNKKSIISFLGKCDPSISVSTFGCSKKSNMRSKLWKEVFCNLHLLEGLNKPSSKKITENTIAIQIVDKFFNPSGHNPSKEYMTKKGKKFVRRKITVNDGKLNVMLLNDITTLESLESLASLESLESLDPLASLESHPNVCSPSGSRPRSKSM